MMNVHPIAWAIYVKQKVGIVGTVQRGSLGHNVKTVLWDIMVHSVIQFAQITA